MNKTKSEPMQRVKPTDILQVETLISDMDRLYKTTFKEWIKDESNVHFMSTSKRSLFIKEFNASKETGYIVMNWIMQSWTLPSITEFILKMFYDIPLCSLEFSRLIASLTMDWDIKKTFDLVNLLMVGETSASVAEFIFYFSKKGNGKDGDLRQELSKDDVLFLVKLVNRTQRWSIDYMQKFLLKSVELNSDTSVEYRELILMVYTLFEFDSSMEHVVPQLEVDDHIAVACNSPNDQSSIVEFSSLMHAQKLKSALEYQLTLDLFSTCFENIINKKT